MPQEPLNPPLPCASIVSIYMLWVPLCSVVESFSGEYLIPFDHKGLLQIVKG